MIKNHLVESWLLNKKHIQNKQDIGLRDIEHLCLKASKHILSLQSIFLSLYKILCMHLHMKIFFFFFKISDQIGFCGSFGNDFVVQIVLENK